MNPNVIPQSTPTQAAFQTNTPNCKSVKIFTENLVAVTMNKTAVNLYRLGQPYYNYQSCTC